MAGARRSGLEYADVRSALKTGDLVVFSGASFFSRVIKLRLAAFPGRVALWEATTLADLPDVESGRAAAGVQLVWLSERIAGYDGEFKLRALDKPVTPEMEAALAARRSQLGGRPYEQMKLELVEAALDGWFGQLKRERLHSLFCSELVAEAYQAMRLLPESPPGQPSNEYTPRDFARRHGKLLGGYALGKIVAIG